ncbi:histidine--tRNA ligase [Niabella drilacis]|uniref:Histidine--tRNA ligase n=1 Tax=Niabella drilacis (strain DSM 25811 / CCM 8410 / CCUG 62505 / LMG 26954 / E90) TaxID=1285928 RepID=A0A1G6N024_NIADE|nr:histidine--tRNA ligase [Niabella drilacis]SDC61162.1 histidyl-tRNA synthetase [Niabella drilacis]
MKPSLPQGTRDFDAATVRKRNYIFNTIKEVFELYGFQPLETPAMENLDTLMGKYGEEGDKLIFKILNNGLDNTAKADKIKAGFEKVMEGRSSKDITERALRYDLTIPFARYVAMNYNQLTLPFKRYQLQPVWRADRPQKGRYREFYQCDADVVGSRSLINELELTAIYATVFRKLGLPVEIRINNRKILTALAAECGGAEKMIDIAIAIDKLDKIGIDKVKEELADRGLLNDQVSLIQQFLEISGTNEEKLARLKTIFAGNSTGQEGIQELEYIVEKSQISPEVSGLKSQISIDATLARGLNYYTGTIFEVKAPGVQIGSIGGGGRYDDLTGLFGVPDVPGVGISFGVDRIYDVLTELNLFPADVYSGTRLLFFNLGTAEAAKAFELMQQLRAERIACELFHEAVKFDKQFKYAEKKGIPYVAILGSKELEAGMILIKNLRSGEQEQVTFDDLRNYSFREKPEVNRQ